MGDFSPDAATTVWDMDDDVREALAKDMTIDLTTIGRKSGQPRKIEIWMIKVGERIVITGTPGPRDWFANLLADPTCTIHLKERIRADLAATATPITDPEVRTEVFEHVEATWYRRQGEDLETLVAEAPMVQVWIDGWP